MFKFRLFLILLSLSAVPCFGMRGLGSAASRVLSKAPKSVPKRSRPIVARPRLGFSAGASRVPVGSAPKRQYSQLDDSLVDNLKSARRILGFDEESDTRLLDYREIMRARANTLMNPTNSDIPRSDIVEAAEILKKRSHPIAHKELSYLDKFIYHGNLLPELVELLVKKGADPNALDIYGDTPLHYAASKGWVSKIKALLNNGADLNVRNFKGETPLHSAAKAGKVKAAEALLNHVEKQGAEVGDYINLPSYDSKWDFGKTAMDIAVFEYDMYPKDPSHTHKYDKLIVYLSDQGANIPKGVLEEAFNKYVEDTRRLIENEDEGHRDGSSSGWGDAALGAGIVGASAGLASLSRDSDEEPEIVQEPYA